MAFDRPPTRDLTNVASLNAALLDLIAADPGAISCPAWLAEMLAALNADARRRLSKTPILLLSLRESDVEHWAPVFERRPERDLLAALDAPTLPVAELTTATLGFLWQLAGRDAYAVRVVSGGSIEWCEELGNALLVDVLEFGRRQSGLVSLRHADSGAFWRRLLTAATADEQSIRAAARLAAMQAMLTGSASASESRSMRSAAMRLRVSAVTSDGNSG